MPWLDELRQYYADLSDTPILPRAIAGIYAANKAAQDFFEQNTLLGGYQTADGQPRTPQESLEFAAANAVGGIGGMYVPVSGSGMNALSRMAAGEVVEDAPRAFSALHDRVPRVEIDDSAMTIDRSGMKYSEPRYIMDEDEAYDVGADVGDIAVDEFYKAKIGGGINHPKLKEANSDISNISVTLRPGALGQGGFGKDLDRRFITAEYGDVSDIDSETMKSILLHEYQHPIQNSSGFAGGGSPSDFPFSENPYADYRRLAGEIEARDTAARMNLNALQRQGVQPYTGYGIKEDGTFGPLYDIGGDIPLEDYIVRRDGGNALAITYHGSPHTLSGGKFDHSYMGSGEGAQAYGWGTYLADQADVAKTYAPRDHKMEDALLKRYNAATSGYGDDYISADVYERAMLHHTPDEIASYYTKDNGFSAKEIAQAKRAITRYRKMYEKCGGR